MIMSLKSSMGRKLSVAGAAVGAMSLLATAASAGECPPGKSGVDLRKPGATAPKGVTDNVLSTIDLGQEAVGLKGHDFRLRRLVIEPGGVVPWHSHAERPALIYVVSGTIHEYASTCSVPIVHKAGEVSAETHATAHWWQNTSNKPVVLISVDIQRNKNDHNM
jgi:quercetin dioxygenase-like cupin family protein